MYDTTDNGLPDPRLDAQFYDGVPTKRLLAWVADTVVITALTFLVSLMSLGILFFFYFAIWAVVGFLYRALTISLGSGTWGMRLFGIELRNGRGERFSGSEALMHTFLFSLLNVIPIGLIINAIMMLTGQRGQGLHDYVMGSTAINRPAD